MIGSIHIRGIMTGLVVMSILWLGSAIASAQQPAQAPQPIAASANDTLQSPQATMQRFLWWMNQANRAKSPALKNQAIDQAAACLDFSLVGQADASARRETAVKLLALLDRLGTVHLEELPDATQVQQDELTKFRYFPQPNVHDWVYGKVPAGFHGQLVLTKQQDGGWRFSDQTVKDLETLHRSLILLPKRHEGTSQLAELIAPTWQQTRLRGWLGLLISIFASVLLGKAVQGTARSISQRLINRGWRTRGTVLENAASPLSLGLIALGLAIGLQFIHAEPGLFDFVLKIVALLYILAFGWFLYNAVDVLNLWLVELTAKTESKLDDMLVPLVRKSLRIFLVIIFSLLVAQNIFGLDITSWLAGLGIAGLAVSLAAQDSIKNIFGSATVFFDQPFGVGDAINFEGQDMIVEEIGFRSTKMRTFDGHLVTVPNMKFTDSSVRNITRRPSVRRIVNLGLVYDTTPAQMQQAITMVQDIFRRPEIGQAFDWDKQPPRIFFNEYQSSSLNLQVIYWYELSGGRDWWSYLEHAQQFNMAVLQAFNTAGLAFAYPTQTLFLESGAKPPVLLASSGS